MRPGQKQKVDLPEDDVLHLSQVCLHEPKAGKNYLSVQVSGVDYTLCCLEKAKTEHQSLDLFFGPDPPTFHNKGASEVHLSGYMEQMNDKDEDDEGSEQEGEVKGKTIGKSTTSKVSPKASPKASPGGKVVEAKVSPKASAKVAAAPAKGKDVEQKEEDDEDDEEEGEEEEAEEGEESEEPEESEEEAPPPKKSPAAEASSKRKAEASQPPAKKAKAEAPAKAAGASKEAAAASPKAAASKDAEYVQQLVSFLKEKGKTTLSDLGSKVKRPPGAPKIKNVISTNSDKFVLAGDAVELKK